MNIHSLNELNRKCGELKKDADQVIDQVTQTLNSMTWLVSFAKKVEPQIENLEKISVYAEIIPGLQSVISDLRLENQLLRDRQNNTAIIFGKIAIINAGANPPRVEVHTSVGDEFLVEIQKELFNIAILKVGFTVKVEARLKNHKIPGRGIFAIFNATRVDIINSGTVDEIFEVGYNGN